MSTVHVAVQTTYSERCRLMNC